MKCVPIFCHHFEMELRNYYELLVYVEKNLGIYRDSLAFLFSKPKTKEVLDTISDLKIKIQEMNEIISVTLSRIKRFCPRTTGS